MDLLFLCLGVPKEPKVDLTINMVMDCISYILLIFCVQAVMHSVSTFFVPNYFLA